MLEKISGREYRESDLLLAECPTTECAYGEGYDDKPGDRDPKYPVDQDREDWNGWHSTVRL